MRVGVSWETEGLDPAPCPHSATRMGRCGEMVEKRPFGAVGMAIGGEIHGMIVENRR